MDSENPEIIGYVEPSPEQLKAQRNRSLAIGFVLVAFVTFVFVLMLYKLGFFGS